jgi:dienelactone hydrolase
MIPTIRTLSLAFAFVVAAMLDAHAAPTPVTLTTADHVKVFATYYGTGDASKPIVLLFHQAGANGAEYSTIAPKLNALGFNALAVDQRSGGSLFGRANKTVKTLGRSTGYRAALPDLQAALDWARGNHQGKIIICGSSYSASLVFLLAANNPGKIAGLMAFSPGEYLGGRHTVRNAAAKLRNVAVFVTSASDRGEIAAARAIVQAVPGKAKTQFVPQHAPHGASALIASANPTGAAAVWAAVERFLAAVP